MFRKTRKLDEAQLLFCKQDTLLIRFALARDVSAAGRLNWKFFA